MNVREVWGGGTGGVSKSRHSLPPKCFFPGAEVLGILPIPKLCQPGIFLTVNYINAFNVHTWHL